MAEQTLRPIIGVAMKWVSLRPEVDPITATVSTDDRLSGASAADRAALETALQHAARVDADVVVVCVGSADAEPMLRDALACGATRAVRIQPGVHEGQPDSAAVAAALADVLRRESSGIGPTLVCCGDWSLDRGSGSVPVLLAHYLGVPHALGLVSVRWEEAPDGRTFVECERRLDGGRREVLHVTGAAVISVEGAVATLRRASLSGVLAARTATIALAAPSPATEQLWAPVSAGVKVEAVTPHRPSAPQMDLNGASDPFDRVSRVLGVGVERTPPMRVVLDADTAAELIRDQLVAWGQTRT